MAGINEQHTRHANRATVSFIPPGSSVPVQIGEATNINVQEDSGPQGAYFIGSAYPREHYHTQYRCNISIGRIAWDEDALNQFDLVTNELIKLSTFDLTANEGPNLKTLFDVTGITLGGRSLTISANQPISTNVQGQGLYLSTTDMAQPA